VADPPESAPYVFIDYSSHDRPAVLRVVERLRVAEVEVWLDRQEIEGGAHYGQEIATGIARCAALVLMCTEAAMQSRNVRQEIVLT
jgi:hypothetical protein